MDNAALESVSTDKRCGMVAIFRLFNQTNAVKDNNKPFNPLLGETFEMTKGDTMLVTEQVSHHPPITAVHMMNNKLGWRMYTNQHVSTKFRGTYINLHVYHKIFVEFDNRPEKFEVEQPVISIHNLIGNPYIDIGGTMQCKLLKPEGIECVCTLRMTKKSWFSSDEYKVEGEVERLAPGKKPVATWKIAGNWDSVIRMTPIIDGEVDESAWEVVYQNPPYPDQCDY